MRLDHLDFHVPNVAQTRDFFVRHFGFTEIETRGADALAILNDEANLELVISRPVEKLGTADTLTVGYNTYHIGFTLNGRAAVDRLHAELRSAGMNIDPPREMRGMYLFYCYAPGKILVEVRSRLR